MTARVLVAALLTATSCLVALSRGARADAQGGDQFLDGIGETGLVAPPTAEGLAGAFDELWRDGERAAEWGRRGRARYDQLGLSWDDVLGALLA